MLVLGLEQRKPGLYDPLNVCMVTRIYGVKPLTAGSAKTNGTELHV